MRKKASCVWSFLVGSDLKAHELKMKPSTWPRVREKDTDLKQIQRVWCRGPSEAYPRKQKSLQLRSEAQKQRDRTVAWSREKSEPLCFCFVSIFPIRRLHLGKRGACWLRTTKAPNGGHCKSLLCLSSQGRVSDAPWEYLPETQEVYRWQRTILGHFWVTMATGTEGQTSFFSKREGKLVRLTTGQVL